MILSKSELLSQIRTLVADVTRARFEGVLRVKLARAHGYADGYMRALLDAGLVDRAELLKAIGDERGEVVAEGSVQQLTTRAA
jgi:hypothetical protein